MVAWLTWTCVGTLEGILAPQRQSMSSIRLVSRDDDDHDQGELPGRGEGEGETGH